VCVCVLLRMRTLIQDCIQPGPTLDAPTNRQASHISVHLQPSVTSRGSARDKQFVCAVPCLAQGLDARAGSVTHCLH
jgi:hypothetical protein